MCPLGHNLIVVAKKFPIACGETVRIRVPEVMPMCVRPDPARAASHAISLRTEPSSLAYFFAVRAYDHSINLGVDEVDTLVGAFFLRLECPSESHPRAALTPTKR